MASAKLERTLALAGAVPFVAAALLLWLGPLDTSGWRASALLGLASYSLVILSFMAGTLWQQHSVRSTLLSNVIALVAWFSYWLLPVATFLAVAIVLFSWLLWLDWLRYRGGAISGHYWQSRRAVTALVCAALLAAIAAL